MTRLFLLSLAAVAMTAGAAAAQRPINPGRETQGSLTTSDPRLDNGAFYDLWSFNGRRGESVTVTMRSEAFDALLAVGTMERGTFRQLAQDDDGGGGTDSRVTLRLPYDGTYVIRATSLHRANGTYTLFLRGGSSSSDIEWHESEPVRDAGGGVYEVARGGRIVAGRGVSGRLASGDPTLDNGAYFHLYTYDGRRGERLRVTLRSTAFDAYLVLGTRGGRHGVESALARDDDGAGGRDSRIEFTLPNDGEYVIRVQSLMAGSGAYTLEVESNLAGGYGGGGTPEVQDAYGAVDGRLVGRWGLTVPGTRVDRGDWTSISASASLGILSIDASGAYSWRKNGRIYRGQLEPFTPARGTRRGERYYLVDDGRDEFYVFFTEYRGERYMQVNQRGTDTVVAYGYRDGGY